MLHRPGSKEEKAYNKLCQTLKNTPKDDGTPVTDEEAKEGARNVIGFCNLMLKSLERRVHEGDPKIVNQLAEKECIDPAEIYEYLEKRKKS